MIALIMLLFVERSPLAIPFMTAYAWILITGYLSTALLWMNPQAALARRSLLCILLTIQHPIAFYAAALYSLHRLVLRPSDKTRYLYHIENFIYVVYFLTPVMARVSFNPTVWRTITSVSLL